MSAWVGRLGGKAAMRQAMTDERRVVTDEWRQLADGLTRRLAAVEARLDDCEERTHDAERRASETRRVLDVALDFLRRGMTWFTNAYPGVTGVPIPDELKPHL